MSINLVGCKCMLAAVVACSNKEICTKTKYTCLTESLHLIERVKVGPAMNVARRHGEKKWTESMFPEVCPL